MIIHTYINTFYCFQKTLFGSFLGLKLARIMFGATAVRQKRERERREREAREENDMSGNKSNE